MNPHLSTTYDYVTTLSPVVDKDSHDISRPREPFMSNFVPDQNNLDDKKEEFNDSAFIKIIQQFMKSSPLAISYSGPIDGTMNQQFINSIVALQTKISFDFNKYITLISADKLNPAGFSELHKLLKISEPIKPTEIKQNSKIDLGEGKISGDPNVSKFEKILGLPQTGVISPTLISAIQSAEKKIADKINKPEAVGMVINPTTKVFNTTPEDLQEALSLLNSIK